jgi:hypothetical protein
MDETCGPDAVGDKACRKMKDIYADGAAMCTGLWDVGGVASFAVVALADETASNSYSFLGGGGGTAAPLDQANPNDLVTAADFPADFHCQSCGDDFACPAGQAVIAGGTCDRSDTTTPCVASECCADVTFAGQMCHLEYYHDEVSSAKDLSGSLCSAWSDNGCCSAETAASHTFATASAALYGDAFAIDACGAVSEACQAWFLAESCLYECDVHIGRYRTHPPSCAASSYAEGNPWQVSGMPVKVTSEPACRI